MTFGMGHRAIGDRTPSLTGFMKDLRVVRGDHFFLRDVLHWIFSLDVALTVIHVRMPRKTPITIKPSISHHPSGFKSLILHSTLTRNLMWSVITLFDCHGESSGRCTPPIRRILSH